MSPAPATIFTTNTLFISYDQEPQNPQPTDNHPCLSAATPSPSITLHHHLPNLLHSKNMSNETFKTDQGNVPKLTEENHPVWKQNIRWVLITKLAYNIVTGVELLTVGNGVALHPLQGSWHDRANKALA